MRKHVRSHNVDTKGSESLGNLSTIPSKTYDADCFAQQVMGRATDEFFLLLGVEEGSQTANQTKQERGGLFCHLWSK